MILYLDLPLLCLKINSDPGLHLLPTSAPQPCVTNKDIDLTTRSYPLHVKVVILLLQISAGAGPLPAAREFTLWHFLSFLPHSHCSALLSLLLAALTPILGSGDLSCLLLLLKMEFAFLFPILLVAFGCSPAWKGGCIANCMDHIQTTSAPFTFLCFHFFHSQRPLN